MNKHLITTKDQAVARRHGLEVPRLGSVGVPGLSHGYQPLGGNPTTLDDRIHQLQSQTSSETSVDTAALEARVAALEAILAGYGDEALDVCDGGSTVSKTFLTK